MEFLEVGGPFFGIESKWKYEGGEIKLSSGDTLILYTDGVTEAMDRQERLFSDERLQQIVKVNYKNAPAEILQAIENDVAEYHGSPVFEDDFTLLIARCLPK